jgi:hypothetical protein
VANPYVPAPSYNLAPIDVWGNFQQGMQIGGALRQRARERQYGEAFGQGGWDAVADTAGGLGDLDTANTAQTISQDREETALARVQRNAAVLGNAATSLMGVPYEQRMGRLQQMAPMLEQMGLPAEQIAQFDPSDENLENIRALQGQFSQYTDIREVDGAIVGITADGRPQVLREPQPQWQDVPRDQLPEGARFGQRNTRTGQADFDYAPASSFNVFQTDGDSSQGVDFLARQYIHTGQLPTGIARNPRMAAAIYTRAAELAAEQETTPEEVAGRGSRFRADSNALSALRRQRNLVENFERAARANLDTVERLSTTVDRSGVPVMNRWIQLGQREVEGNPEVSAFHNAVTEAVEEYVKVVTGATGAAAATDSARRTAHELLSTANTPEQMAANIAVMREMMSNRISAFDEQEADLVRGLSTARGGAAPAADEHPPPGGPGSGIGDSVGAIGAAVGAMSGAGGLESLTDEELDALERELEGR